MKTKLSTKSQGKRLLHRLAIDSTLFDTATPMNREQRRTAAKQSRKVGARRTAHNVEVQGPGAASLRTVPCNDGLAGALTEETK